MEENDNWLQELQTYAKEVRIKTNEQFVKENSYDKYKMYVKKKIHERIIRNLEESKKQKTKMRTTTPGKKQKYIEECTLQEASTIMRIRLHMVHAKGNYGGGNCRKCHVHEETTEHVLECHSEGVLKFDAMEMDDVLYLKKISSVYLHFDEQYKIRD